MDKELREDLKNLDTYNEFIAVLKKYGLVIDDLHDFGTLKYKQYKTLTTAFKRHEDDKERWAEFKKAHTTYYCFIHAPAIVAYGNKPKK